MQGSRSCRRGEPQSCRGPVVGDGGTTAVEGGPVVGDRMLLLQEPNLQGGSLAGLPCPRTVV